MRRQVFASEPHAAIDSLDRDATATVMHPNKAFRFDSDAAMLDWAFARGFAAGFATGFFAGTLRWAEGLVCANASGAGAAATRPWQH